MSYESGHKSDESEDTENQESSVDLSFTELCKMIGGKISTIINEDMKNLTAQKRKFTIETLLNYDVGSWLTDRPSDLITLLPFICSITDHDLAENLKFILCWQN